MKRLHDSEPTAVELPKEVWIEIFHVIADQRLLPMRAVSQNWNEWIVKEGLTELTYQREDFVKRVKSFKKYQSVTGVMMRTKFLTEENIKKNRKFFRRLKTVYILGTNLDTSDNPSLQSMRYMTNLVTLRLGVNGRNFKNNSFSRLVSLENLVCHISNDANYSWLSGMKQIKSLSLIYLRNYTITYREAVRLDQFLVPLTQLITLYLKRPKSTFSFIKEMTLLENLIIDTDGLPLLQPMEYNILDKLANLKLLMLPSYNALESFDSFSKMDQLECLYFPGIPKDITAITVNKKLQNLKHLVLHIHYEYFITNIPSLTKFIQSCPHNIDMTYCITNRPDDINFEITYDHLLDFIPKQGNWVPDCSHCREIECPYFYLSCDERRVLIHY